MHVSSPFCVSPHLCLFSSLKFTLTCSLSLTYLIGFYAEVSCWIVTGERQSSRIRNLYLKTILRQDIEFFDTETNTGEVIGRMSGDTVLIQEAMGEKVLIFFLFSQFIVEKDTKPKHRLFFLLCRLGNLYN